MRTALACALVACLAATVAACGADDGPRRVEVRGYVSTLAGGLEDIYVGMYSGTLERRDGDDGDLLATRTLDGRVGGVAVADDAVFVTVPSKNVVVRLNATTLDEEVRVEIATVDGTVTDIGPIAATGEAVVVGGFDNVIVLDPETLDQIGRTDDLEGIIHAVAVTGDAAYAATGSGLLYQFSVPDAEVVERRDVEYGPVDECGLVAVSDGVWLAGTRAAGHYASGTLEQVGDVELDHALAVIAAPGDGAMIRATTGDNNELLVVTSDGTIERRVDADAGECLARASGADTAWGTASGNLIGVDVG